MGARVCLREWDLREGWSKRFSTARQSNPSIITIQYGFLVQETFCLSSIYEMASNRIPKIFHALLRVFTFPFGGYQGLFHKAPPRSQSISFTNSVTGRISCYVPEIGAFRSFFPRIDTCRAQLLTFPICFFLRLKGTIGREFPPISKRISEFLRARDQKAIDFRVSICQIWQR